MSKLQQVAKVLKDRFPNLTVMEVIKLAEEICLVFLRDKDE